MVTENEKNEMFQSVGFAVSFWKLLGWLRNCLAFWTFVLLCGLAWDVYVSIKALLQDLPKQLVGTGISALVMHAVSSRLNIPFLQPLLPSICNGPWPFSSCTMPLPEASQVWKATADFTGYMSLHRLAQGFIRFVPRFMGL